MSSMPMYLNTTRRASQDDRRPQGRRQDRRHGGQGLDPVDHHADVRARRNTGRPKPSSFDRNTVSMTPSRWRHRHPVRQQADHGALHVAALPSSGASRRGVRTIQTTNDVMGGPKTFTMISTTTKFHDENPKVYAAFVAALKESFADDRSRQEGGRARCCWSRWAARAGRSSELVEILDDPDIKYTTKPEGVMKYADFMNSIGTLKNKPTSIERAVLQRRRHCRRQLISATTALAGGAVRRLRRALATEHCDDE